MAVLLPLSAFEMSADEKEAKKIPLRVQEDRSMERNLIQIPINSYYIGSTSVIQTIVTCDLGVIDIAVTNTCTGEFWTNTFDSGLDIQTFLPISGAPGLYVITYLTSFGDIYEGTLNLN